MHNKSTKHSQKGLGVQKVLARLLYRGFFIQLKLALFLNSMALHKCTRPCKPSSRAILQNPTKSKHP